MKPVLKVPGSMLLKLIYDEPLSTFAFKFNLRRYTEGWTSDEVPAPTVRARTSIDSLTPRGFVARLSVLLDV